MAEPFAFSVADNAILLENFFFNGLTWAEAAYSSLPVLSWQQIVIGDPLSVATLIPEPGTLAVVMVGGIALLRRRPAR